MNDEGNGDAVSDGLDELGANSLEHVGVEVGAKLGRAEMGEAEESVAVEKGAVGCVEGVLPP